MGDSMKLSTIKIQFFLLIAFVASTGCQKNESKIEKVRIFERVADEVTSANYLSGQKFCAKYVLKNDTKTFGRFIKVPKDYHLANSESTLIYAYFKEDFDPTKPTVIFFDGGPGQVTHKIPFFISGYNQLHFDQRGLGCSAPEKFETYKDSNFYSSENTARDAKEIITQLGLKKVSLYGVSYGTVPATVFASLFKELTTSLTLEGVMYSGDYVFTADLMKSKMQKLYDSLSPSTQRGLDILSSKNPKFFTQLIQSKSYSDKGFINTKKMLEASITEDGKFHEEYFRAGSRTKKEKEPEAPQNPSLDNIDRQVHGVFFCKEFKMSAFRYELILQDRKVVKIDNSAAAKDYCSEVIGVASIDPVGYVASAFPVSIPVSYFQGTDDGATIASGAIQHWSHVPKKQASLLLKKAGGHNPNLESIFSRNSDISLSQQELFRKTLKGDAVTDEYIGNFNRSQKRDLNEQWLLFTDQISQSKEAEAGVVSVTKSQPVEQ